MSVPADFLALDVLQANIALLAEKERLEQERHRLLEVDRMRTEFLSRVSHDLRTPLSSIIGFAELLLAEGDRLGRGRTEYVQAIHRNGHGLLALINDLLDLSSLESGRMALQRTEVPLAELLADLQAATVPVLDQAGLHALWPDPHALVGKTARCDRRRIHQALVNLIDNARKFTPRGGTMAVTMEVDAGESRFSVADTGPGLNDAQRDRLFRPFASQAPRTDGGGLGLAIVKAIVDRHGGRIELDRRAPDGSPGRGCTFCLHIPQESPL